MKSKITLASYLIISLLIVVSCKKTEETTPAIPEYQTAIEAKFKAIGWATDGHAPFNGTGPVKTVGGKGYVQYYAYGGRKTAIYFYSGKGAFAVDTEEMIKYDALGQDNWGLVVSDPKATKTGGCGYIDVIRNDGSEGIITCQNLVDGDVYKKYKEMGRWDGSLGLPTNNESNLTTAKGRWQAFVNGQIYWGSTTGAQAFWGKVNVMYGKAGFDGGWLGLPTESCDPKKTDNKQYVRFQYGAIDAANCGNYYSSTGLIRYQNGTAPVGGAIPPCY